VRLTFVVPADRRHITGTEDITFRPDRSVDDIVLRLWPNNPASHADGGSLTVSGVTVDGKKSIRLEHNATLLRVTLQRRVPAGTTLRIRVQFRLTLPVGADERWGVRDDVAWWGSGFPLLAYVRGEGYAEEPATALFAEAATSEEFRLADLTVVAPGGDTVLATGMQVGAPTPTSGNRRTWHFSALSVRDVAVSTGQFRLKDGSSGGVPVTVGVTASMSDSPSAVLKVITAAMRDHVVRFGPFPYERLVVTVIPDVGGGIEFPGAIYLGHAQLDATPSHEVAHEWFYGLIGDNQARDPWLDEAFATYVEALENGRGARYASATVPENGRNRVGRPMTFWESRGSRTYFRTVYLQGASALREARRAVGTAAFDRAIRCYVNANAHRVARPVDLARALRGLPKALSILRRVGALP
jgi:aminopeptidase N